MLRVCHPARRSVGAAAAALWAFAPVASAQFQITTYKAVDGNPTVTSMAIADQYYNGVLPIRFVATGTAPQADLFENGGAGQFLLNNPFPGLDQNFGPGDTDGGGRLMIDLNNDGDFNDAGELVTNDDVLSGPHDFTSAAVNLAAGNYLIEYSMFEGAAAPKASCPPASAATAPSSWSATPAASPSSLSPPRSACSPSAACPCSGAAAAPSRTASGRLRPRSA